MLTPVNKIIVLASLVMACTAVAALSGARADPLPAFDRNLTERLVRAQEAQAHALEELVRATEKCRR